MEGLHPLPGHPPRGTLDEGKLAELKDVRALGSKVALMPWVDETIVFVAFLDAGLRLSCIDSVVQVLQMYGVDLA